MPDATITCPATTGVVSSAAQPPMPAGRFGRHGDRRQVADDHQRGVDPQTHAHQYRPLLVPAPRSREGDSGREWVGSGTMGVTVWPGNPYPLGAAYDGGGTNFAVFSEVAERVELCPFDDDGTETRVDLP